MTKVIAVTGGIGCGKSTVCRILRVKGFEVYDCDSQARRIMDSDKALKTQLQKSFGEECVVDGIIDRRHLGSIVFNDPAMLRILNGLVHEAVREDLRHWTAATTSEVVFVETAIFFQSGLNAMVDAEWRVTAPLEERISRVMARNNLTRSEVLRRIASQDFTPRPGTTCPPLSIIENGKEDKVLPQVNRLLASLRTPRHTTARAHD